MNQEITVSADVIDYLYSLLRQLNHEDYGLYTRIIEQNINTGDYKNIHFQNWYKRLDSLPEGDNKESLKKFVENATDSGRRKIRMVNLNSTNKFTEFAVAESSSDKIYFLPEIPEEVRLKNKLTNAGVEIHDKSTFKEPEHSDRLKNIDTVIGLKIGCRYNLSTILSPFLRDSKHIYIVDPFLPNYRASKNLWKIFDLSPEARFEIFTYSYEGYIERKSNGEHHYQNFMRGISSRRDRGMKISITDISRAPHLERFLYTERFQVYLPGGLDCLDEYGVYEKDIDKLLDKIPYTEFLRIEYIKGKV